MYGMFQHILKQGPVCLLLLFGILLALNHLVLCAKRYCSGRVAVVPSNVKRHRMDIQIWKCFNHVFITVGLYFRCMLIGDFSFYFMIDESGSITLHYGVHAIDVCSCVLMSSSFFSLM